MPGWEQGKGWGWIWGAGDELGAMKAQTPQSIVAAMQLAKQGKYYDLGVPVDRRSFLSPVHPHTEVLSFRTPENAKRQYDIEMLNPQTNTAELSFMSDLVMISDHAGTQIDGL